MTIVNLRAENPDEQRLLDAFWERGVRVCSGGSMLGISLPGFTYILELDEAQVMSLMHLLGTGREQERGLVAGAMIGKGSFLESEDVKMSLISEYQGILEEVVRSMRRRDGGATMGFPVRLANPKKNDLPAYPVIIGSDLERAKDVNYFYYEPGTDASTVVQAAVDYLKAKMEEAEG